MNWLGLLIVSPIWGLVSTQLFFQIWLAIINFILALIGFINGKVPRKDNAMFMVISLFSSILFYVLLHLGSWLLTKKLSFGYTWSENTVYWVFAGLSALYILRKLPARLRKVWRNVMVPGSLELDIMKRNLGLDPDTQ